MLDERPAEGKICKLASNPSQFVQIPPVDP